MSKKTAGEVVALVLLQFIINFIFISLYPEVAETALRAGIMGSLAFIALFISGAVRSSYTHSLVGSLSLLASWYINASLVFYGKVISTSALSAVSQIGILIVSYFIFDFCYKKLSLLEPKSE
ncbi:MAG: hypothetical protein WCW78_02750 [Candidatus Paceibacterota bacterium]|jgi:hypothetical protein